MVEVVEVVELVKVVEVVEMVEVNEVVAVIELVELVEMGKVVEIDCEKSMKLETSLKVKSKRSLHWCRSMSKQILLHYRAGGLLQYRAFYYIIGQLLHYRAFLLHYRARAFITLSVGTNGTFFFIKRTNLKGAVFKKKRIFVNWYPVTMIPVVVRAESNSRYAPTTNNFN